jgi:hypothetical protein
MTGPLSASRRRSFPLNEVCTPRSHSTREHHDIPALYGGGGPVCMGVVRTGSMGRACPSTPPVPHKFPSHAEPQRDTPIQQPQTIAPAVWCEHPDHSRFDHMYLDGRWASPCVNPATADAGPLPEGVRRVMTPGGPEGPTWADGVFSD